MKPKNFFAACILSFYVLGCLPLRAETQVAPAPQPPSQEEQVPDTVVEDPGEETLIDPNTLDTPIEEKEVLVQGKKKQSSSQSKPWVNWTLAASAVVVAVVAILLVSHNNGHNAH